MGTTPATMVPSIPGVLLLIFIFCAYGGLHLLFFGMMRGYGAGGEFHPEQPGMRVFNCGLLLLAIACVSVLFLFFAQMLH